jgi:hypothetical protein
VAERVEIASAVGICFAQVTRVCRRTRHPSERVVRAIALDDVDPGAPPTPLLQEEARTARRAAMQMMFTA